MSTHVGNAWESKKTEETRNVEKSLKAKFERVDSYRYNTASVRIRVIDPIFEGRTRDERESLVDEEISKLPESTQRDIVFVLCLTPGETNPKILGTDTDRMRNAMFNDEFENPQPSRL
jgi:hypothetical protein